MATQKATVKIIDNWQSQSIASLPTMTRASIRGGMMLAQPDVSTTLPARRATGDVMPEVPNAVTFHKRARLSGWGEPYNLSTTVDSSRIQAYIRSAERGDTWQLFTLFRDMIAGYTHLQNEFAKRKLTVVGQPHIVLPRDKNNKDDKVACAVINEMIEHCDNWDDALDNLLDATLWPVSVSEKIFEPVSASDRSEYKHPVRFRLRKLDPVSPTLFCYKIPYLASGLNQDNLSPQTMDLGSEQVRWNADDWEPELRFYSVHPNGYPDWSPSDTYAPDKAVHVVHRGTNLSKTIRDNFGGHLRAISFWWFLATQGRDWFGRYMQRWAHPFIVGKVDSQQKDTVAFMQNALSLSMEIGGLIIDKAAEAQLMQAASLNGAEGYKLFLEVCNDEVSKVVVGQTLSSSARATGLGSGVAQLHGQVRQDYRQSDMRKLSATLVKQLFRHYLRINGYSGQVRGIIWGGKDETQVSALAKSVKDFSDAGLVPDDDGIDTISERTGISLERAPEPEPPQPAFSPDSQDQKPAKKKQRKPVGRGSNKMRAVSADEHEELRAEVRALNDFVSSVRDWVPTSRALPAIEATPVMKVK